MLSSESHQAKLERLRGIYFVTDDRITDPVAVRLNVRQALAGGVKTVQLRDKSLDDLQMIELARQLREDTLAYDALLIVNDRADVAAAVDADGVHLGPDDLSPAEARKLLGPDRLLGISAGSVAEMDAYGDISVVSYFGCGPVFGTRTKSDAGEAIGVERLVKMSRLYPTLPIIAIGGVTRDNLEEVRTTGVAGAAVVSAISCAVDPEAAAAELVRVWQGQL